MREYCPALSCQDALGAAPRVRFDHGSISFFAPTKRRALIFKSRLLYDHGEGAAVGSSCRGSRDHDVVSARRRSMSLAAESPTPNQSTTENNRDQYQLKQFRALALRITIATRYRCKD